jgi:CRP-like cAMP-binding protein
MCAPASTDEERHAEPKKPIPVICESDLALLAPHLRRVELPHARVLFEEGDRIERLHFPTAGIVSFVVAMNDGNWVEAGMIGNDGAVGGSAALDGPRALNRAIIQVAGEAWAIDTNQMRTAVSASETLRTKLFQHDQLLLAKAQQSAACNALHQVEERLCRWLLRTRDLLQSNAMEITQEFLGQMLGVRRTSVTLAARHLQASGLIKYRRGQVEITDPDGLKEASCECYETFNTQRQRLFDPWN